MSFLLYPTRERTVFQDGAPLLWQLGPYVAVFQRPEMGTTGALLARRVAEDGSEHGDVLIHQLPTGSTLRQGAAEVFQEEWRKATRLEHPNILRTLDTWLGAEDGAPRPLFFQLVTEYVPGETLSTVLAALEAKGSRRPCRSRWPSPRRWRTGCTPRTRPRTRRDGRWRCSTATWRPRMCCSGTTVG
ncbi:hypothetical protein ACLESD_33715 [Pyxidicoccus sp. 3LFB2]